VHVLADDRGEQDGEVRFDPDEAVTGAIRTAFERFNEFGSVRRVWLWFCSAGLGFPMRRSPFAEIRWVVPTYTAIHNVLTNPTYAGAYTYGKTRKERFVDPSGHVRQRMRRLPRAQWSVLIVVCLGWAAASSWRGMAKRSWG